MDELGYATRWRDAAQRPVRARDRARRLLRDGALSVAARVRRGTQPAFLRCLFCHYVFDDQVERFARLLRALSSTGEFVDTATCLGILRGDLALTGRTFHLSFDDGFRNNLTNAKPVLDELGIRAAFFVPTALVGADADTTREYCRRIEYPATIELLRWDDVETLVDAGHDVGSHTRTHARFSDISSDPAALEDEIAGSKRELESRLGRDCRYISWPFGKRADADPTSLAMARRAGYDACFGAFRGSVLPRVTDPFRIPRHHFEVEWPLAHVAYFARGNMESPE